MNQRSAVTYAKRAIKGVVCAICLLVVLLTGVQIVSAASESAKSYFKQGTAAEAREDYDRAFNDYKKAMEKAPNDMRYRSAYMRVIVNATSVHMMKGRKLLAAGDKTTRW